MLSHSVFLVLKHIKAWRHPGEMLSSVQASGNRCRKVKEIEILGVCGVPTSTGKEFCPNKETFMTSLNRKLIILFQENAQFRRGYLKRSLNTLDRKRMKNEKC